jgi:hypothetical protein
MKKTKILCFIAALAFAPSALAIYKCVDEKGITRIGETPPEECANVPMQEVTRSGTVRRTIAPSLTPAQVEAQRAIEEKKKADNKAYAEQSRKDEALLNTYASEREIDMTRDRNIEPVNSRIKVANERIVAIDKRIQQIQDEMEFYKAGKSKAGKTRETPEGLIHDLDRAKKEKATIEKSLTAYDKEIATLRTKYDTDKVRWLALKQAKKAN